MGDTATGTWTSRELGKFIAEQKFSEAKMNITTATAQGLRAYQEDRFFVTEVDGGTLLGVFDGHGGSEVSEFCVIEFPGLWDGTFPSTFKKLAELTNNNYAGTTASVVFIPFNGHGIASVAVIGDSPVLARTKTGLFIGPDHNVRSNLAERAAAEKRGGAYSHGYIYGSRDYGLQMGRALGDANLGGVLSREPEITVVENASWILVATDGVFDPAHSNSPANEIAKLIDEGADAQTLVNRAVNLPTHDNATAILVRNLC